jgi:flavin-binding protein dodecin
MRRSRSTGSRAIRRRASPRASAAPAAVRVHEAVGASTRSWDAAVTDAVRGAKKDAPDPIAVEVGRLWADLDAKQKIRRYRASVKIAYRQPVLAPPRERAVAKRGRAKRP